MQGKWSKVKNFGSGERKQSKKHCSLVKLESKKQDKKNNRPGKLSPVCLYRLHRLLSTVHATVAISVHYSVSQASLEPGPSGPELSALSREASFTDNNNHIRFMGVLLLNGKLPLQNSYAAKYCTMQ